MVEVNADPEVVTAIIRRETHEARAEKAEEARLAASSGPAGFPRPPAAPSGGAAVSVAPPPAAPALESPGFWNAQILLSLAIVVVLLVVWIAERRSRREGA